MRTVLGLLSDSCVWVHSYVLICHFIAVSVRHDTVHLILYIVSQLQKLSFATRSYLVFL